MFDRMLEDFYWLVRIGAAGTFVVAVLAFVWCLLMLRVVYAALRPLRTYSHPCVHPLGPSDHIAPAVKTARFLHQAHSLERAQETRRGA